MSDKALIVQYKEEINKQLGDKETFASLLQLTFKGLEPEVAKRAMLEGYLIGRTFKDFLNRNVYAIPYGKTYSLVHSIDYSRKVAQRSKVWQSAPTYEMDGEMIVSCTVVAYKRLDQDVAEYPATVFFEEYTTGRNLWITKPRTMIAKVAEMHALRKACPEELAQAYTEEELDKEKDIQPVQYEIKRVQEPYEQEEKPNMLLHQSKRQELSEEEIIDIEEQTK